MEDRGNRRKRKGREQRKGSIRDGKGRGRGEEDEKGQKIEGQGK